MKLAEYIALKGTNVADFAKRIGVTQQTVYRYLDGSRLPRWDVMWRISKVTGAAVEPRDWIRRV